jgi:hypothetical protein
MAHQTFINQLIFIPKKSTVDAIVTSKALTSVRVTAFFSGPGVPPERTGRHPQAFNHTWGNSMNRAGGYSLIVDVDLLGNASAVADLRVLAPDGAVFMSPWTVPVTGKAGDFFTFSYGLAVI